MNHPGAHEGEVLVAGQMSANRGMLFLMGQVHSPHNRRRIVAADTTRGQGGCRQWKSSSLPCQGASIAREAATNGASVGRRGGVLEVIQRLF